MGGGLAHKCFIMQSIHVYFKQFTPASARGGMGGGMGVGGLNLLQAAAAANESKPPGNSRGHFKSGVFRLDKGPKFFIHSCAALLF